MECRNSIRQLIFYDGLAFDAINYTQVTNQLYLYFRYLKPLNICDLILASETDGVVIKLNNIKLNDTLGISGKDPRGSIAYKFSARNWLYRIKRCCLDGWT